MDAALVLQVQPIATVVTDFVAGVIAAVPQLLSGLVFLALAYLAIKAGLAIARSTLSRVYPSQPLIVDLFVLVIGGFLWFGVALSLLAIVGLDDIAASLGTAAGFAALGVSYALSNVIADTVAVVYLLRDPDFNPGDRVTTESVTGTVTAIDLRKSRLETEVGDTVVLANSAVEKRWTKEGPDDEPVTG